MNPALARAHIAGQKQIRDIVSASVAAAWSSSPSYDEADVGPFLDRAVPIVRGGQRQSSALTEAFLARAIGKRALGLGGDAILGKLRAGADPREVYRRPFVTVWTALGAGKDWPDAVNEGLARATGTAATDVQLAMRETLREVGNAEEAILGYERVPDGNACDFCLLVAGQRYTTDKLQPIHDNCGCGVDVITATERGGFSGGFDNDPILTREDGLTVEVREHGELGPVLVNGDHHFTEL